MCHRFLIFVFRKRRESSSAMICKAVSAFFLVGAPERVAAK